MSIAATARGGLVLAKTSSSRGICTICYAQHRAVPSSSRVTLPIPHPSRPFSSTGPALRLPPTSTSGSVGATRQPISFKRGGHPAAGGGRGGRAGGRAGFTPPRLSPQDYTVQPPPGALAVSKALLGRISEWVVSDRTASRLSAYGLTPAQTRSALGEWHDIVQRELVRCRTDEDAFSALTAGGWDISRLSDGLATEDWVPVFESSLHRHSLSYLVSHPSPSPSSIPASTIAHLTSILSTTDLTRLAYTGQNIGARSLQRHFHLHVGPTNSGKTYSALKALALAPTGVYAGPLRLLAHEVWERLNLGTVGGLDGVGRACNLLTGEERRIVSDDAGLVSCTVEMLPSCAPSGDPFDVVVIDEIQMMGDSQRGGSWTAAVLGVKAKEVHLCGDDTTVGLLSSLLPGLGDKMTIHRYDRLTPLEVAQESLEGDWSRVQPGDCIVTFSRTNIFAVKKMVEELAGRKCAVVYGALPPETRAEQAREFNEGRAEVLVASDAVGMGLNLKIKRMIFESLHKYNGKMEIPLPLTSVKQIAGRAGRFGMHKSVPALDADLSLSADTTSTTSIAPVTSSSPGGSVTTLHAIDLPILTRLLPLPLPPLPRATLDTPFETLAALSSLLPPSTTYASLLDHTSLLLLPPPHTTLGSPSHKYPLADVVEEHRDRLTLAEMETLCFSPVSVRDPIALGIFEKVVAAYADAGCVGVHETFEPSGLVGMLEVCEEALAALPPTIDPSSTSTAGGNGKQRRPFVPPVLINSIPRLETLHKSLVFYIWLSFRFPIAFPDQPIAQAIKFRTERVLEECLERLPGLKKRASASVSASASAGGAVGSKKVSRKGKVERPAPAEREKGKRVEYQSKEEGDRRRRRETWGGVGLVRSANANANAGQRAEA